MTAPEGEGPETVPPGDDEPAPTPVPEPEPEAEPAPVPLASTAAEIEQLDVDAPRVAILAAARDDLDIMERAETELTHRGIRSETRVLAPGDGDAVAEYSANAKLRGIRVIIAASGPRARLPGLVTAHTELPVIGVPVTAEGAAAGALDGLLSQPSTPPGAPVGWVGLDEARHAAVLAARILGAI